MIVMAGTRPTSAYILGTIANNTDSRVYSRVYGVRACLYTDNTPLPNKTLLIYVIYVDGSRDIFNLITDANGCVSTVVFNPRSITAVFEGDEDYEPSYAQFTIPLPPPTYPAYKDLTNLALLILFLLLIAHILNRFKHEITKTE